ncbi:hypothetical protein TNCV_4651481 [Trichonephila clavipes]|nr:hypothetical protein TNCV_4651481 [Trichonephila clavipes]
MKFLLRLKAIYTDGSKFEDGRAGGGVFINNYERIVNLVPPKPDFLFRSEIIAIGKALGLFESCSGQRFVQSAFVSLDLTFDTYEVQNLGDFPPCSVPPCQPSHLLASLSVSCRYLVAEQERIFRNYLCDEVFWIWCKLPTSRGKPTTTSYS